MVRLKDACKETFFFLFRMLSAPPSKTQNVCYIISFNIIIILWYYYALWNYIRIKTWIPTKRLSRSTTNFRSYMHRYYYDIINNIQLPKPIMTTCPIFLTISDESVTAVLEIIGIRKRKRVKARHCQTSFSRETTSAMSYVHNIIIFYSVSGFSLRCFWKSSRKATCGLYSITKVLDAITTSKQIIIYYKLGSIIISTRLIIIYIGLSCI